MERVIKKGVLASVLLLLLIFTVHAVTMTCPSSVESEAQFSITVSQAGAGGVRL